MTVGMIGYLVGGSYCSRHRRHSDYEFMNVCFGQQKLLFVSRSVLEDHCCYSLPQMMQKFGKSDQTKDEVYEEFVVNFNKQHVSCCVFTL